MLKNFLKSLFENIYTPEIDLLEYIQKPVRPCYKQIVDGHEIDYAGFIEYINKQRDYQRNKGGYSNDFETKLITTPPIFNATQERYQIFRQKILELVDNTKILSVTASFYQNFQKS